MTRFKVEKKQVTRFIFCGLMIYSRVLGFLCVLSLTWLAYATLNYSSSCYLPVTSPCCCVLVRLEKQGFPTVKSLNNGGITKWPTGRCQSSLGFLSRGENGRPSADMYCLIRIARACSHMPWIIYMKCSSSTVYLLAIEYRYRFVNNLVKNLSLVVSFPPIIVGAGWWMFGTLRRQVPLLLCLRGWHA